MRKLTNKIAIVIVSLSSFVTATISGQSKPVLLSEGEMMYDYRIYRTALEEVHAGLFLYITPQELDNELKKIEEKIKKPLDKNQFYTLLLETTTKLKHGHSFLVNDQPYGINYRLRDLVPTQKYLPFTIKIINNKAFIEVDCSSKNASRSGSLLLQINGVSLDKLLVRFQKYIPADGGNLSYKNFRLENFLFHYLYQLLNPSVSRYQIVSKSVTGKISKVELDGKIPAEIEEQYKFHIGHSINYFSPALEYKVVDTARSISYLKVSSFYEGLTNRNGVEFTKFIDSAFQKISDQKVKKLIIDLRDNEGGDDDLAVLLFSYLADQPFKQGNPTYLKSDNISILNYAQNPGDDLVQFAAHPDSFVNKFDGKFILKQQYDESSYATYQPKKTFYNGKLIIVTNGGSFSATSRFINTAAYYLSDKKQVVRFVGENYGGDDFKGYATGGASLNIVLPNSHFRLTIPVKEFTRFKIPNNNGNLILNKNITQDPKKILMDFQLKRVIDYARNL